MKNYKTIIRNDTESKIDLALDWFGERRAKLNPKSWGYVISVWFMHLAPYGEVIFKENGEVKLKKRRGFKHQFEKEDYILRIENQHEFIMNYKIGSLYHGAFCVPKQIPVQVVVHPLDPLAEYESIVIKPDKVREEINIGRTRAVPILRPGWHGYIVKDHRVREVREPNLEYKKRSKPKLQKLEELRDELRRDDPDAVNNYGLHKIWNRDRWNITDEMLLEDGEKTHLEKLKENQEEEQAWENYR